MGADPRVLRRLKLSDLRLFQAVVEFGGMAKAASRMNISQPAVSKAIASLESTLRVRLLDRTPQGVEPTQYGRALIEGGVAVFDELTKSVQQIEYLADPTSGEVRIGCTEAGRGRLRSGRHRAARRALSTRRVPGHHGGSGHSDLSRSGPAEGGACDRGHPRTHAA